MHAGTKASDLRQGAVSRDGDRLLVALEIAEAQQLIVVRLGQFDRQAKPLAVRMKRVCHQVPQFAVREGIPHGALAAPPG